ncbi:hypothetical protein FRIGORI9N_100074 [Frigoribacterium sp. 9N]|nr:hypothetical protein FRIGORI9N_100074 [Frigoribacterium sp. 9N]
MVGAPHQRLGGRLAGGGVAAERVGPDAGPGLLRQGSTGDQDAAEVIGDVTAERQVQWRRGGVHGRLRGRADGRALVVEEHHELVVRARAVTGRRLGMRRDLTGHER